MLAPSILETIGNTPLIELAPLRPDGAARIVAKHEGLNPTGSMKDRMALAMIEQAEHHDLLAPGQEVVEYTGGSTGSSLAMVCAAKGYPLTLYTADCFSAEKIATMRALGADVTVYQTPDGKVYPGLVDTIRGDVREYVEQTGAYWTNQMENAHQLAGYRSMAEEVLADCPEVTDLVMVVGTGGCAMGNARALKRELGRGDVRVTLVEPAESPYLSKGEGGTHGVEGISVVPKPPLLDAELYDDVITVPEGEGRAMARQVGRTMGLFVGTSSGLNLAAAQRVARARGEDAVVVTVLVDTGLKYLAGELFRPEPSP